MAQKGTTWESPGGVVHGRSMVAPETVRGAGPWTTGVSDRFFAHTVSSSLVEYSTV